MRPNLIPVPVNFLAVAVLLMAGALALAIVGCGGGEEDAGTSAQTPRAGTGTTSSQAAGSQPANTPVPTTDPQMVAQLKGDINIDGSSTVFPITEAMAEEFGYATDGNVRITVGVSGTGGGFKKFCAGEIVITDASRPIKQTEADLCAENGIEYIELPVAIDGLSVMVNPGNDFIECMTVDELNTIWAPEAEEVITRWNQVRPEWPDEKIGLYAPGVDSGTFDYFTETVNGESQASRADFLPSEDDNVLVTGISNDRGALGYFGYAYYAENADRLKLVAIDGGSGCVLPTDETINNGSYAPLSRPLFIYVTSDALNQPHIKAFVEYFLDGANRNLISETGYISLPGTVYALTLDKFLGGVTGAAFGGDARLHGTVEEVLKMSMGLMTAPAMMTDLSSLKGDINIDGSSTVFPITEAMAEEFGYATDGNVRITVGVSGTGGGFKKFCAGEIVITDASRPIKQTEADLCAENGIEYIELPVAIDGLSVMVNPGNDFIECMTVDELNTIWAPEAEEVVTRWNQVRPEWPDEKIGLYAPGVDSGTFDYFTETVNGESQASRADFLPSEDDNVLVTGISNDRGALGYFGYAYYAENADRLKLVAIDGGSGCVLPTDETINNGSYAPLSRPLFIYVTSDALNQPHIMAFVEYFLDEANRDLISETGYIPFPSTVYGLVLAKFRNGTTGAVFGGDARLHGTVEEVLQASQ